MIVNAEELHNNLLYHKAIYFYLLLYVDNKIKRYESKNKRIHLNLRLNQIYKIFGDFEKNITYFFFV